MGSPRHMEPSKVAEVVTPDGTAEVSRPESAHVLAEPRSLLPSGHHDLRRLMRQQRAVLVLLATAAVAACSGMGPLSDPTSDKQGGGSSHSGDTAVVSGPSKPATP